MISEHPLIGNLEDLTEEDLQLKLSELWNKLGMARRTGNAHLVQQVSMAIESYTLAYNNKLRKDTDLDNLTSVIDIS